MENAPQTTLADNAPVDAVSKRADGTWIRFSECPPEVQQRITRALNRSK